MASSAQPSRAVSGSALDNRRVAATAIDLVAPVLALIALYAGGLLTPAVALVVGGWMLFYFFALESGGGQTVGKRAMKLRVVDADGKEPSMRQVAMRTLVRVVDLPVIGLIAMMASGDRRQRLGDMAADTHVVDAETASGQSDLTSTDTTEIHPAVPAAFSGQSASKPKRSRPGLGGPEIKLPKLGRPGKAKPLTAAKAKTGGRRTLGGPEIKLPTFGRGRKSSPAAEPAPDPVAQAVVPPAPTPAPTPQAAPVTDAIEEFRIDDEQAAVPEVEVVTSRPEAAFEPAAPEPADPTIAMTDVPEVEVRPSPAESPAPELRVPAIPAIQSEQPPPPSRPAAIPGIPSAEAPPRAPTVPAALDPERRPAEGVTAEPDDSSGPRIEVKPIETVSAMDLIMQDAEHDRAG